MTVWEAEYKRHKIRVENRLSRETLFIDGQKVDETSSVDYSSKLMAMLPTGELVVVNIGGRWKLNCTIFIAGKQINVTRI